MDLFAHCWPSLTTKVFPLFCFALCTVTAASESPQNSDSIGKLSTNVCNILAGVSGYTQVRIEILNNGLTETYTWSTTLAEGCEAYLGRVLTACQTESSSTSCNEIHLSFGRSSPSTTISLQPVNSAEIESRTIATVPSMTIASKETESTSAQQATEEHQTPPASHTSDSQKATQGSETSSDAPTPSSTSPKSAPCLESQAADTPSSSMPSATSAAPYCVIKIPVHTFVLQSKSAHLEYHLRHSFKSTGLIEYHVSHWPANVVWKALELIYLGDYSDCPSPLAEGSDNIHELVLHCSIYMLARYWNLPERYKETPLRRFKQAVENEWEPYAFLDSVNMIFSHLPSATLTPLYRDYRNQICSSSDSILEDDIVQFVSQQIESRRGEFVGERSVALFQCVAASPLLLSLVLDRWLAEGGVRS
ncbi:hypothetical protein CNMCM8980_000118 [Aspergillus fumigatiaffinis]|uniref:BTB domain-containing protein n=1 Tax=Aspergillus fumigatiaffinis TaxID=340414 RepID=A0A8H4GV28_9EURO|nr:hypothetical protein CNMCM6805_001850 [Aspergillus fumigatiaffinis]KAF4243211.1 hypothetical protein CNMCM8980_000118 [Aspergillus fumigatiaffinis]